MDLRNILYNDCHTVRTIYKVLLVLACIVLFIAIDEFTEKLEYNMSKVYIVTSDDYTYHIYDWCHLAKDEMTENNSVMLDVRMYKIKNSQYKCCDCCADYYKTKIQIENNK